MPKRVCDQARVGATLYLDNKKVPKSLSASLYQRFLGPRAWRQAAAWISALPLQVSSTEVFPSQVINR